MLEPGALGMLSVRDGDTHVITLAGELCLMSAGGLEQQLRTVEQTPVGTIAVDLRKLTFIDSTGIRVLVHAQRRSWKEGNRLVVVRGAECVRRIFELCGLADRLAFVDEIPAPA
jgi:anti-sigma B factor antagonist